MTNRKLHGLSIGTKVDDLRWHWTKWRTAAIVFKYRYLYSLYTSISPAVTTTQRHMIIWLGFTGSVDLIWCNCWISKIQDGGWRPYWMSKNGHNFATGSPIDVMFGSRVGFLAKLRFIPYMPSCVGYTYCCRSRITLASAGLSCCFKRSLNLSKFHIWDQNYYVWVYTCMYSTNGFSSTSKQMTLNDLQIAILL